MEELDKSFSRIRNMMKTIKAEIYAIENPDLIALDEYNKKLYLKVLCTVIQYENEASDMQVLFLDRIIKGIGVEEPLEEYMRKAMEISEIDIQEFISFMKENRQKYYFALEGMLLVAMGNTQKNMEYLAELIELCGVSPKDLKCLSLVAKSVLQQDSSYYDMARDCISEGVKTINCSPYILNYYVGAILNNKVEKVYTAPCLDIKSNIAFPTEYTERKITFRNLAINLKENWTFNGCEVVEFVNCRLVSKNSSRIVFKANGNVMFRDCELKDFNNIIAYLDSVNEISFERCTFMNCGRTCSHYGKSRGLGGMFLSSDSENDKKFTLKNCTVQNCYIESEEEGKVTGILLKLNYKTEYRIINNKFIGCQCINNTLNYNYIEAIMVGEGKVISSGNTSTGIKRLWSRTEDSLYSWDNEEIML